MIPHNFGGSEPLSLGVEEELMIVDPATFDQVPAVERLLRRAGGEERDGRLKTELHASILETNTFVLGDAVEVDAALRALRRLAQDAAAAEGLALAASGTHPFAVSEAQQIVAERRYLDLAGYGGISVRRQGVQGLHVHVGMPSADACWACLEAVLPWLPAVLALSANSPWLGGRLTGMASNRAPVLAELPRAGVTPAFASYAEWEAWVERLVSLGAMEDATRLWWDVRPHPSLGTLELRVADQPTDVGRSAALAALLQAMCAAALDGGLAPPAPLADHGRADYLQNRWSAARFGPQAKLLHPDGDTYVTAANVVRDLLERVSPAADGLGGADLLGRLDPASCEGRLQAAFATPREAAADLVARSVA